MPAGVQRLPTNYAALLGSQGNFTVSIGANADGMLHTNPWAGFGITQDLLANDSDKTFTVPANHLWIVHWVMVEMITTATVGSRDLVLQFLDAAANLIGRYPALLTVGANGTEHYMWGNHGISVQDISTDVMMIPFPAPFPLPAGFDIRVFDLAAVDAAADDMEVTIGRQEIDDS